MLSTGWRTNMKSVSEVSKIAHVSIRTLHHYDEKSILKPSHVSETGYRYYSSDDIEKLKLITVFKELGLSLKEINSIMNNKDYDEKKVIETQKQMLILKRNRLNYLIKQLDENNKYTDLCFEEHQWELVWDEIYASQGIVQSGVLEPVKNFVDMLKENRVEHVLDLGCGTGRNTVYMAQKGLRVTATDISEKGLDLTYKKAKKLGCDIKTSRHDMRNMPFKENTFDAVLCSWVCGHGTHEDMVSQANEMLRVVKPGGMIFVDYPSTEDDLYGIGNEIAKDTFLNNVPGEEKIPHHYSDESEISEIYGEHILTLEPYTYRFNAKGEEHKIEAFVVILKK